MANVREKPTPCTCMDKWYSDICASDKKMSTGETFFKYQPLAEKLQ